MSQYDLSLLGLHTFLSTHTGRDQFGNLVQYVTQALAGVCTYLLTDLPKNSAERARIEYYNFYFKTVSAVVGNARRTVRWLASLGVILALRKLIETNTCAWQNNPTAFFLAQASLLFWHLTDNYRWLILNKLVDGDAVKWKKISFSSFSFSALVSSCYFFNELFVTPPPPQAQQSATAEKKRVEAQRGLVKNVCTLISCLHTSELIVTHEAVCGTAGAIAAIIVIQDTFPKLAPAKKE